MGDLAAEGVVSEVDGSEEGEVGYVRGERAYQTSRHQVYGDDAARMSATAADASPSAEIESFVP